MNRGMKSLLAMAVVAAAVPASAEGSFPGSNGRIAVSSPPCGLLGPACDFPRDRESFISTVGPKGNGRRTLPCTETKSVESIDSDEVAQVCADVGPAWSPDGELLALFGATGIRVTNPDGSAPRKVAAATDTFGAPAFTPDGKHLAYTDGGDVMIVPLAGGPPEVLVRNASSPAFSATGRLAYDRNGRIWVAAADGSGAKALPPLGDEADWAPGGKRIIFSCGRGICRMTARGRKLQHVRGTKRGASDPVYSPDGRQIAFVFTPGMAGRHTLYTVKSLGGRTTRRLGLGLYPAWRPLP